MIQWQVPLSDIDMDESEIQAVEAVLRSRWLSMGEVTARFEQACAEAFGARFPFAVTNGTAALHLACLALGLGPGDEVILPSLTFVATANAIRYTGATPVFADITSLDDLTVSPQSIESKLTPRTRAIMLMHYGGYLCAMPEIQQIARKHGLHLIEDAAHAPGALLDDVHAGSFGELGCFSFFANKNLVTGEGGLVVTSDPEYAEKIRLLRSHGMTSLTWDRHHGHAGSYDVLSLGYNYRIDEIRAALGLVQLNKLAQNNQRRGEIVAQYRHAFAGHPALSLPFSQPRGLPAYHLFPILLKNATERKSFLEHLRQSGIQTSLHYPPIHLFSAYRSLNLGLHDLPLTEQAADRLVTLPLFPTMADWQIQAIIETVNRFQV